MARYKKWWFCEYVPSAMGMADKRLSDAFAAVVAAGMICGDGMWSLSASLLAIARINPPKCMRFLSRSDNFKLEVLITRQGLPNRIFFFLNFGNQNEFFFFFWDFYIHTTLFVTYYIFNT
ncbi:putative metal-nicotianamine transporter YSL8 [Dendrobium catenatum]|uniref:Putative metal-nicotianamine transporter YSL8 n=1 Tax=Dendrobium catenatum TaxID=906689 RepID=A0A2I0VEK2_9ASPA|nr:putative metal-nicotianamine transporter YSL8 [Dendrobium catenatum]